MEIESKPKVFLLPFIYYYTLSIAVLLVGVYLLAKLPDTNSRLTFAQSENAVEKSQIQIDLSSSTHESNLVTELTVDENGRPCDLEIAKQIDTYFGKNNSPLAGHGCDFVFHAKENNISPYLVAAIAQNESSGGKKSLKYEGKETYNAWGYGAPDDISKRNPDIFVFNSWEDGIGKISRVIAKNKSHGVDPAGVVKWYNPTSVVNANGIPENSEWAKSVQAFIAVIQAL